MVASAFADDRFANLEMKALGADQGAFPCITLRIRLTIAPAIRAIYCNTPEALRALSACIISSPNQNQIKSKRNAD